MVAAAWDFRHKTIETRVNGRVVQSGSTDEMLFDMHYLIADLARTITLLPGDVVRQAPGHSWPVVPDDVVTVEVERVGALASTIGTGPAAICADVGAKPLLRGGSVPRPWAATGSSAASGRPSRA